MSAGRFKSKDDYFAKRSGFTERVISVKPQKTRKRTLEPAIPLTMLRVHFCKTVDSFEIAGKGRFRKGEYPLDDALRSHLDGDATVLVNPLSHAGETAFTVVRFDLSEQMAHPFSRAREFADELEKLGIPSLIEVAEGGKGHYHLWIFHEEPVLAWRFSDAIIRFGREVFGVFLETVPSVRGDEYMPLPLQGESVLLQRRVFVNSVGKMIRDQGNVLRTIEYCPKRVSASFIERTSHVPPSAPRPEAPVSQPVRPEPGVRAESGAKTPVSPYVPPAPEAIRKPFEEDRKPAPPAEVPSPGPQVPLEERGAGAKPGEPVPIQLDKRRKVSAPSRVLLFVRRGREYGVEPAQVQGIYPTGGITAVPGMGGYTRGVMRIGKVGVTVLDIARMSDPLDSTAPMPGRIVALGAEFGGYGLLADRVFGIADVSKGVFTFLETDEYMAGMWEFPGGSRRILFPDMSRVCRALPDGSVGSDRTSDEPDAGDSYVVFALGGGSYAVPARAVERILSSEQTGGVGSVSAPVIKHIELLAMMDSGTDSACPGGTGEKVSRSRTLVVSHGKLVVEVPVDRVEGVRRIDSAALDRFQRAMQSESPVRAVAKLPGRERPVFILDPEYMCR